MQGAAKHIIFTTIALLIFSLMQSCSPYENTLGPDHSNTIIKSESKWNVDVVNSRKINLIHYKEFDRQERLVLFEEYSENGKMATKSTYVYHDNSGTEEKSYLNADGEVDSLESILYVFSNDGDILEKQISDSEGTIKQTLKYFYDNDGNIVRKMVLDQMGNVYSETKYEYSYNENDRIIERLIYEDNDASVTSRDSLSYRNQDRSVEIVKMDGGGDITVIHTFVYNASGLITAELISDSNGKAIKKHIFEYEFYR